MNVHDDFVQRSNTRGAGRAITYVTQIPNVADAASYNFNGANIGVASADRVVLVGAWVRSAGAVNISSLTIGGVSATEIVEAISGAGPSSAAAIYALNVAAGATANIVLNASTTCVRSSVAIWTMTGAAGSVTASDTLSVSTGSPAITGSLDIPDAGVGLAIAGDGGGTTLTCTWTGMTERFDAGVEGVNAFTGGDSSTPGTGQTITATFSGATSDPVLVAASFGP